MNTSAYFFVAIIFAVFLTSVIASNLLALFVALALKLLTMRKVRRLS